jgi:hypothetical protein
MNKSAYFSPRRLGRLPHAFVRADQAAPLLFALLLSACANAAELSTIKVAGKPVTDAGHIHVERDKKTLPASASMALEPGDTIRTDADTTLVIRLGDARAVLMPNTKVTLGSITDWFGRVFISGWLQGKSKLVTAAVKGTQYVLDVDENSGLTSISVLEGTVEVSSVEKRFPPVELTAAQRVRVRVELKQAPTIETIQHGEYNTMIDAANAARDPVLDALLLPDLAGMGEQDAEARLRQLGFQVSRSVVVALSPDAVGLVAGQVPRAGTATRRVELQIGRLFKAGLDKALLNVPAKTDAGSQIALSWTGPNEKEDMIVLVPPQLPDDKYDLDLVLSAHGGRGELRAPAESGKYELRYLSKGSRKPLARASIEVTPPTAALKVPNHAAAGTEVTIEWQGPNRKGDKVHLVRVGTPDGTYVDREDTTISAVTGRGTLRAPAEPGEYEVRYMLAGKVFKNAAILARAKVTVAAVQANLNSPSSCEAGASFEISWTGPNAAHDRIYLVPVGRADYEFYETMVLKADPGHGVMRAPTEPGEYELRYALWGFGADIPGAQKSASFGVIARAKLIVTPVSANLDTVQSAEAGSTIRISWTGPKRSDDWLGVAQVDSSDGTHWPEAWISAETGSGELRLPATPGTYEVRYILGGPVIHRAVAIGRATIEVTPAKATISAPATIRAGTDVKVSWSGPKRSDDRIYLVPVGTPDGAFWEDLVLPAESGRGSMKAPTKVGEYELRYRLGGIAVNATPIIARTKVRIVP